MLRRTIVYSLVLHLAFILTFADGWVTVPDSRRVNPPARIDAALVKTSGGRLLESATTQENAVENIVETGGESLSVAAERSGGDLQTVPQPILPRQSFEPSNASQKESVLISETISQSGISEYRLNIARVIRHRGYSQQIERLLEINSEMAVIVSSVAGRRVPQVVVSKGSSLAQQDQLLMGLIQAVVSEAVMPAELLGKDFAITLQFFSSDQ